MKERSHSSGFSLPEILTVVAILGSFVALALPNLRAMTSLNALNAATAEIRGLFHLARSKAISRQRNTAIKFVSVNGRWTWSLYQDGDWDGVRNDDIVSRVDQRLAGPHELLGGSREIRVGIASPDLPDPDSGERLGSSSPVRFNRSTLCSFSQIGSGTAGSIFLTNLRGDAYVVRVFGSTGRIRSMRFNNAQRRWERR
ncbi:MAG TPA: GspH/FimT family pseudopilin [Thermoanaerobaculia bacterium]|nr:GspH/FimT family pseudopilin [Thermoanaerobaculia bacterium]